MGNAGSSLLSESDPINPRFLKAVVNGELDIVKKLISDKESNGLDINHRDKNAQTPLMWACYSGHIQIINVLIANGANLSDCDQNGYTSLHHSVVGKQKEVVKLLVTTYKDKMNINAKNVQGDSALHRSVHYSEKQISSLLITNGANVNLKNNLNETPLDKARTKEMREYLMEMGAKYNQKQAQIEGGDVKEKDALQQLDENDQLFIRKMAMKNAVIEWLSKTLSLPEYVDFFVDNGYDRFDAIVSMKKEDLKDIGIKMGHIKIILNAIDEYKESQENIQKIQRLNEPGFNDQDAEDKEE